MNLPFLPDISGIVRVLIAFGLVAGTAAHVIGRLVSRRGRGRLPSQLFGIAMVGIFAAVFLVAEPEWGTAGCRFLFEAVFDAVLPQSSTPAATVAQTRQR